MDTVYTKPKMSSWKDSGLMANCKVMVLDLDPKIFTSKALLIMDFQTAKEYSTTSTQTKFHNSTAISLKASNLEVVLKPMKTKIYIQGAGKTA